MRHLLSILALALALLAAPAFAQSDAEVDAAIDAVLGDHAPYRAAFDAIQAAVAAGDAEAVAAYIPIGETMMVDGKEATFATEAAFVAAYPKLFAPEIVKVVTEQKFADLFVNSQGVMFGDGQVWLNGLCRNESCSEFDVKIITIQSTAN